MSTTWDVKYQGVSTLEKPILSKLYAEGWADVVNSRYHPSTTVGQDNNGLHHFLAKAGNRQVGILSFWEDETFAPSEARVMMLYVKSEYRKRNIASSLMCTARDWCRAQGYGELSATVHVENTPMRLLQDRLGGFPEYITYQHKLNKET